MGKKSYIEISLEEFKKLHLIGYKRQWIKDGEYKKLCWILVNLNNEIEENIRYFKYEVKTGCKSVVVAIHKNIEHIKDYMNYDDFYYYDKWLNRSGASTYQLGCDIEKLYTTKNKWYIIEDYFDIPREETEAIYFIKLEEK